MGEDVRSDEDLVVAIASGPGALEEFYRRHVASVLSFGTRRFSKPEDVADFTAEVFVQVLTSAARYDPARGAATAWLFGIAANVARSLHRRDARIAQAGARWRARELLDQDDTSRIEARIDAERAARQVWGAIAELPERDQDLLSLVVVDGLGPTEAARALGLRPGTARAILSRRRHQLRVLLSRSDAEIGGHLGVHT